jgi:hypothetical protein
MIKEEYMTENHVFHYTVSELIEILNSFPPETPVLTSGYENGYENIQQPALRELVHKPDNPYYDGEFQLAGDGESDSVLVQAVMLPRLERD